MGSSTQELIHGLLKDSDEPDYVVENPDIVDGDVLVTINGVDYAIVIEEI